MLTIAASLFAVAFVLVLVAVMKPAPIEAPTVERLIAFHSAGRHTPVNASTNDADPRSVMIARYAALQNRR